MGGSILARYNQGVDVAGIFEQRGSETEYSEYPLLHCAGVPVLQDGNSRTFHHKVLIIDRQIVVTGSFNFSRNADESNDENVVILRNPEIAALYLKEFDKRWQEAQSAGHEIDFSCP
jgi:phosphatidylserine/phosphatidylglycerophosphate/cardiolipin synthase-like enzyme